jgi:hypothetical protein
VRERALTALAALFLAAVVAATLLERSGSLSIGALEASADLVAAGEVWRLFTSARVVEGPAGPQLAATVVAVALAIRLAGATLWWLAALVGHVGSALVAYAIIGIAVALGSGGAEAAADDPDYGISCVLGATLGVLFAFGVRRRRPVLTAVAALGLVALLPFSIDWYGPEHPLSFALGAAVAWRRLHVVPVLQSQNNSH